MHPWRHHPGPGLILHATRSDDYAAFHKVNSRLLNTSRELKNVPIRVYIPQSPDGNDAPNGAGSFKVVQSLVQPRISESTAFPFLFPFLSFAQLEPLSAILMTWGFVEEESTEGGKAGQTRCPSLLT